MAAFALGGLLLSWAYTAPPLRLKKRGLGELDVLITWGPLMVGGVYYAGTGTLPWQVLAAATVYALLPTTVLLGKHIDKLPYDGPGGTRTFPVVIGEGPAKALTQAMMVAYYVGVVVLVVTARAAVAGAAHARRAAHARHGAAPVRGAQADRGRRRTTRSGHCGGRRSRSSTPAAPVACSSWGCSPGPSGPPCPDRPQWPVPAPHRRLWSVVRRVVVRWCFVDTPG